VRRSTACASRIRSRSCRWTVASAFAVGWVPMPSSPRSSRSRCRSWMPRPLLSVSCTRIGTPHTSGPSRPSFGGAHPAFTSSARTRSRRSFGNTSAPRQRRSMRISVRVWAFTCVRSRSAAPTHGYQAAGHAFVGRCGGARGGRSASGADPGACVLRPRWNAGTITDANLLLGRLPARLAAGIELDLAAAERAVGGIDPEEAVALVNAEMLLRARRRVAAGPGRGVPSCPRGALRIRGSQSRDRARRGAHRRRASGPDVRAPAGRAGQRDRASVLELDGATCWVPPGGWGLGMVPRWYSRNCEHRAPDHRQRPARDRGGDGCGAHPLRLLGEHQRAARLLDGTLRRPRSHGRAQRSARRSRCPRRVRER
jgi:hypothetical protein